MTMKTTFCIISAAVAVGMAAVGFATTDETAVAVGALSLRGCLGIALSNNPSLSEAQLGVEAAEKGVRSAEGRHYPRLSLDGSITAREDPIPYIPAQSPTVGPHFSDRFAYWGPTLTVPLYQGGQIARNVDLARLRQQMQDDTLSLTRYDVIANVVNTFNKILQLRKLRDASAASVHALVEQRKNVQQLYDVKRAPRVDLLKIDVQLANEQQRLLTVDESLGTLAATLRTLMGESVEGRVAPVAIAGALCTNVIPLPVFADGLRSALAQRPEYLLALKGVEEAGLNERLADGRFLPTVSAVGGVTDQAGFRPSYDRANWFVGVTVSLPIFDSTLYADLARRRVEREKTAQHLTVVENQVRLDIQIAVSALQESQVRVATAEQVVAQADESFRIEQQRYQTGAGSMADMLLAQAADVTAAANHAQALFDYDAALVAYRRATGTLEEYLK